ncbi:MAG: lysine biosynthesis protein LysW [Candidatus Roizmanbacteria bacterium]
MNTLQATCPVCDVTNVISTSVEVSEIITCTDCNTRLVVDAIGPQGVTVSEAPAVEEDWGE